MLQPPDASAALVRDGAASRSSDQLPVDLGVGGSRFGKLDTEPVRTLFGHATEIPVPNAYRTSRIDHRILDDALDYGEALRNRQVWQHAPPHVKAHFEGPPPLDPMPPDEVYEEYVRYILPHQLGNNHPRFWGWVAGTGTVMGMFAELLTAAMDAVSGSFSYLSNNYVEMQVLDWCKTLLGYPSTASGLLTSREGHGAILDN
jgi:hypothetical protein